jgi:DNA-binding beta-propeller fold protein YncE
VGPAVYLGNFPSDIASAGGYLWVAMGGDNDVVQFDPQRRVAVARIAVGKDPIMIAAEGSHVWTYNADPQTISRIDY